MRRLRRQVGDPAGGDPAGHAAVLPGAKQADLNAALQPDDLRGGAVARERRNWRKRNVLPLRKYSPSTVWTLGPFVRPTDSQWNLPRAGPQAHPTDNRMRSMRSIASGTSCWEQSYRSTAPTPDASGTILSSHGFACAHTQTKECHDEAVSAGQTCRPQHSTQASTLHAGNAEEMRRTVTQSRCPRPRI